MIRQRRRSLIVESLESRVVLSGGGLASNQAELQSYIVVLKDSTTDVAAVARSLVPQNVGQVGFVYEHALRGFSAWLPASAIEGLKHNPQVDYIEADGEAHTLAQTLPTGVNRIDADLNSTARINGVDGLYPSPERVNVDVAIIDTGIDYLHPDLNVAGGVRVTTSGPFFNPKIVLDESPTAYNDGNGHGTHVAGTVAALDNGIGVVGVAPGARLWAVGVLNSNGSGSWSQVIAGMDWVTQRASTIEVANMSLGGGYSQAVNDAVQRMVTAGVFLAVAAGNDGADASNYSPASAPNAFTVSAIVDTDGQPGGFGPSTGYGADDTLATFSNYGSIVDAAAPGVNIYSTWKGGTYNTISGTSMATPHVAGAAALYIASHTGASVSVTASALLSTGQAMAAWRSDSADVASDPDSSHEPMVYVGPTSPVDNAPTVGITSPISGATVSGSVSITAIATDDYAVTKVEFFVNGTSIGVDTNGGDGWSATWNTATYTDGVTYSLTAQATDNATTPHTTTSAGVPVTVDKTAPNVSIDQPAQNAVVLGASVLIKIAATDTHDAAGTLTVRWNIDGGSWQSAAYNSTTQRYEATWDSTTVINASHVLNVSATDQANNTSFAAQNFSVNNPPPATVSPALASLTGTSAIKGKSGKWEAYATALVVDGSNPNLPLAGLTVQGTWGSSTPVSGVTGADGTVTFASGNLSSPSIAFTVTAVGPNPVSANNTITINKDGSTSSLASSGMGFVAEASPARSTSNAVAAVGNQTSSTQPDGSSSKALFQAAIDSALSDSAFVDSLASDARLKTRPKVTV